MSLTGEPTVISVGGTAAAGAAYDVVVGHDLARRLQDLVGGGVQRVAVLYAAELATQAEQVLDALVPHYDVLALGLPDGEAAKTVEVAADCWDALGEAGFTRSDAVVTFGGGSTTDLGGWVAACWLRGVRVVHVPTTLLAMVDAAVGGKTGVNTAASKNLVGAFHEPAGVLCDLSLLATLPRAELVAGLGEVVKCGFVADPEILRLVQSHDPAEITAESAVLRELVERAIRVKAEVVTADLRETGGSSGAGHPGREALNYGHTLAHAIESAEDYRIRHGEAVAIGCVFVAELARRAGSLPDSGADLHHELFARVGLPTTYAGADFDQLLASMRMDKKTRGSQLRFVVLDDIGRPRILAGPAEDDLRAAYDVVRGG